MNLAGRPRKLVWLSATASTALVVHVNTEMRSGARYALDILRTDDVVTSHSGGKVLNRGYRRREGAESLPTVPGLTPELLLRVSTSASCGINSLVGPGAGFLNFLCRSRTRLL